MTQANVENLPKETEKSAATTDANLLDNVNFPSDIRNLSPEQSKILAQNLRDHMIAAVSKTGGHLGAGLGVVELTIALHTVFNTPDDRIIWDVGHQAYPHKILTGRRDKIGTIRQKGGLHPFPWRGESEYDVLSVGHSSTSISAGIGVAIAAADADHSVTANAEPEIAVVTGPRSTRSRRR